MKRFVRWLGLVVVIAWIALSVAVQLESDYTVEHLHTEGQPHALVLYHPSRDAAFTDDLSAAFAEGMSQAGFSVDRATVTSDTPADTSKYALVAVVSNTYYWTPDVPTLRYLKRASWRGQTAVGLIGGAGSTDWAQQRLEAALSATGAEVRGVRSFWLWRPNDEARMNEPNRAVATDLARKFGVETARALAQK